MLVLSRKPNERIFIGDHVTVTVVRIGPNNVRLGIDAPRSMNVVREELGVGSAVRTATPLTVRTADPTELAGVKSA